MAAPAAAATTAATATARAPATATAGGLAAKLAAWERASPLGPPPRATGATHAPSSRADVDADADAPTPEQARERGNEAFKRGDFASAEALYSSSLTKRETVEALTNRALARVKLGRAKDAEADCSRALLLDPGSVKAFARRATARAMLGAHHLALEDFSHAERLEPANLALRRERERAQAVVDALAAAGPRPAAVPPTPNPSPPASSRAGTAAPENGAADAAPRAAPKNGAATASPSCRAVEEVPAASAPPTPGAQPPRPRPRAAARGVPLEEDPTLLAALSFVDTSLSLPERPPTSAFAFGRLWKDVRGRGDLAAALVLDLMDDASVSACFSHTLEPELLLEILRVVRAAVAESAAEDDVLRRRRQRAPQLLRALARQPSFKLTSSFLVGAAGDEARGACRAAGAVDVLP